MGLKEALDNSPFAAVPGDPRVFAGAGSDPYDTTRSSLASLDLSVARGKRVLLKPNAGRAAAPGSGITTHPQVVAAAIDAFAEKVIAKNVGAYLEIQGHTDNIGSESYNLSLGYKRAEKVMKYLSSEKGFPLHRMNVTSYGEYKPIADNSTREGRAKNRRVALVLMK